MKSSIRTALFALIALPVAACGGDRDAPQPTETSQSGSGLLLPEVRPQVVTPREPRVKPAEPVKVEAAIAIPSTYAEALALGTQLAAKGEHARAKEMFEAASELDKKQADPHIELARLYIASNERALAIRSANKAVKLAPGSSQAYNTLGRAELARHSYDDAIEAFRQATDLNPDNVWAWNNLGYVHLQREHYQDAVDALVEATTRKGTTGYMWNNLGTAYEQLDQLDDARLAFEEGGKLGSAQAVASRKRLEGVDSIAIYQERAPAVETYDAREEMPVLDDAVDADTLDGDAIDDDAVDEHSVDDEPAAEAPSPISPV